MKNGYRLDELRQMTDAELDSRVFVLLDRQSGGDGKATVIRRQVLRKK